MNSENKQLDDFISVFNINLEKPVDNNLRRTVHFENINAFDSEDLKKSILLDKTSQIDNSNFLSTKTTFQKEIIESKFETIHYRYRSN